MSASVPGHATFRLLDVYTTTLDGDGVSHVRRRIQAALKAFPALEGHTVTVGRIPPSVEMRRDPVARAHPYNHLIELPIGEPPTNMTLFHEIAHLAIYQRYEDGEGLPRTSEEFTSLYALRRMQPGQIYDDRIPYFGEVDAPKDEWPTIADRALDYRDENGANSHYLQRAREWFNGGSL